VSYKRFKNKFMLRRNRLMTMIKKKSIYLNRNFKD